MAAKGLVLGVRKLGVKLTEKYPFERGVREKMYTKMVGQFLNALDYKLFSKWVPGLLIPDQKQKRVEDSERCS